ncbi:hypothetical protein OF83DRAFT_843467 [Amylostereum chailletii]|nr:hypothetical protein OF83DRAFT_843467 [Amylostereum chailletii]
MSRDGPRPRTPFSLPFPAAVWPILRRGCSCTYLPTRTAFSFAGRPVALVRRYRARQRTAGRRGVLVVAFDLLNFQPSFFCLCNCVCVCVCVCVSQRMRIRTRCDWAVLVIFVFAIVVVCGGARRIPIPPASPAEHALLAQLFPTPHAHAHAHPQHFTDDPNPTDGSNALSLVLLAPIAYLTLYLIMHLLRLRLRARARVTGAQVLLRVPDGDGEVKVRAGLGWTKDGIFLGRASRRRCRCRVCTVRELEGVEGTWHARDSTASASARLYHVSGL